jgi:hypothetical protein
MTALDDLIEYGAGTWTPNGIAAARAELATLRAKAARCDAYEAAPLAMTREARSVAAGRQQAREAVGTSVDALRYGGAPSTADVRWSWREGVKDARRDALAAIDALGAGAGTAGTGGPGR